MVSVIKPTGFTKNKSDNLFLMVNVLVTGASGFIGGFICNDLVARGYRVVAAVRPSSDISDLKHEQIEILHWNFSNIEDMAKKLSDYQIQYIIHNTGLTKSHDESEFYKVNAQYLENLVSAISFSGIVLKKLVFISSLAAYGPADFQPDGIVKNTSKPHPVTVYGKSKLRAEQFIASTDLPYIIIRPTAVYGPKEKDLLTVYRMINQGWELVAGLKPKFLTFIYVKDLVKVIADSLESAQIQKTYFISDGKMYEANHYNKLIKNFLGNKTIKVVLPYFIVGIVAHISGFFSRFTGKYPPLNPEKMNEIRAQSWNCDISDAVRDLDFNPAYSLEVGLKETLDWCRDAGWLK